MIAPKFIQQKFQGKIHPLVKVGSIGIDLALDKLNLVQLGLLENKTIAVKEVCSVPYGCSREEILSSSKKFRALVHSALKNHHFLRKNVVTSIPSQDVRIISVSYSKEKSSENETAILKALSDRVDDDLSQYVIDYIPVRSSDKDEEQVAIVALAKNEIVFHYLELFRMAGLNVDALEIRPSAINRYVYISLANREFDNVLAINFGVNNSFMTITSGRRTLFDSKIDFGSSTIVNEIATALEMPFDEALELIRQHGFGDSSSANKPKLVYPEQISKTLLDITKPLFNNLIDEINRALLFSASENRGKSINQIYFFGVVAAWAGVDSYIKEKLTIPARSISSPLDVFEDPFEIVAKLDKQTPEFAIAIGHALREFTEL